MEIEQKRASEKEKFEFLYKRLDTLYEKYYDSIFKVSGFFIVVIGWLLTSKNSQAFLHGQKWLAWLGSISFTLINIVLLKMTSLVHKRANKLNDMLSDIKYFPNEYHSDGGKIRTILFLLIGVLVLGALATAVLWFVVVHVST